MNYDATYFNAEVGTKLGSDDGVAAFSTPFATLHKLQGFNDILLGTGSSTGTKNGVKDMYITAKTKTKVKGITLVATYHDLASNEGSIDYGTERDLVAKYKFANSYILLVKFASYSADDFSTDTTKLWV